MTALDEGFSPDVIIELGEPLLDPTVLDPGVVNPDQAAEPEIVIDQNIRTIVASYSARVDQLVAPDKRDEVIAGIEDMQEIERFLQLWGRVWGWQFRAWNN